MSKMIWWGYKHSDGGVHIKRCSEYFMADQQDDCEVSPFVSDFVFSPGFSGSREEYESMLRELRPEWFRT